MNVLVKAALAAAALLAMGCAAAGCASSAAAAADAATGVSAAPRGSVQACIAFGVRAIEDHRTVTAMPAACRGLSRAEVNFALGRAIYLVAGRGQHKVAWRHRAAVEGARLAKLIIALSQSSGGSGVQSAGAGTGGAGGQAGPVDRRPLAVATLALWLLTVGSGGYMLARFVIGGGLRRQIAAGERMSPAVVLSHFGLATTGLLLWAIYLATSRLAVAWAAVALLLPVIGFGMATLIIWTGGSSRRKSGTSARTSGEPPGTSAPPSGTSAPPPGTSAGLPGTSAVPPGASGVPSGTSGGAAEPSGPSLAAPSPAPPADAPTAVQLAEARDQVAATPAARRPGPSRWLTLIIPIIHGLLASTTILLALLTALGAT